MKKYFFPVILAFSGFLLYYNSLSNQFTWDDIGVISGNISLQNFNGGFWDFFKNYFNFSNEHTFRPLATFTYVLNYRIWGLNPFGFHLFSVLLHIINVLLLFFLLNRIFKNSIISFAISMLYLAHPVLTETIDVTSFNEDLLVSIFFLSALIMYIKKDDAVRSSSRIIMYILSAIFLFFALLSKEMAATFVIIAILYDICLKKTYPENAESDGNINFSSLVKAIKTNGYFYLGYILITSIYLLLLFSIFKTPDPESVHSIGNLTTRLIYIPYAFLMFLKLSIFPISLNALYDYTYPVKFFSFLPILSYLLFTAVALFCIWVYRHSKIIFFGICWFFISLFPVLNIIEIFRPLAERYLYLSLIGLFIAAGGSLIYLFGRIRPEQKKKSAIIVAVISTMLFSVESFATFRRTAVWKDQYTLITDTLSKSPDNALVLDYAAEEFIKKNMLTEAEQVLTKAILLTPEYPDAHMNLSKVYIKEGKIDLAEKEIRTAFKLNPDNYFICSTYGTIMALQHQFDDSHFYFKKAIAIRPELPQAYLGKGNAFRLNGKNAQAIEQYKEGLTKDKKNQDLLYNLASCYMSENQTENALLALNTMLLYNPNDIDIYFLAGTVCMKINQPLKAEEYFRNGLRRQPDRIDGLFQLGMIYAVQNKLQEAIQQWEKILMIDPNNTEVKENIKKAKLLLGK